MLKILYCSGLIDEVNDSEKILDECLDKGLIRFLHEEYNPAFIILEKNINSIKEIIGDDYGKINEISLSEFAKDDCKITLDNEEQHFPESKILEIYNSECPYDTIKEMLDNTCISN